MLKIHDFLLVFLLQLVKFLVFFVLQHELGVFMLFDLVLKRDIISSCSLKSNFEFIWNGYTHDNNMLNVYTKFIEFLVHVIPHG